MIKILFLAANPKDTDRIRLDEEVRAIRERLRMATHGGQFAVEQEWAVRVSDVQGHLLRHQPQIVHFSGHGSRAGKIVLEDQAGHSKAVPPDALKRLFATLKDDIRCVVLNTCFSEIQASAIATSIECVVGMSAAIDDDSAVSFAASFYQALGFGRDVQTAFDLGCGQIGLESLEGEDTPKLMTAPGVDARTIKIHGDNQVRSFDSSTRPSQDSFPYHPIDPPNNGCIATDTGTASIEITINRDFGSFTKDDQYRIMRIVADFLGITGDVRVINKRPGSVKLTLELTPEQAERLLWAVKAGGFAEYDLIDAELIEKEPVAETTAPPPAPAAEGPEDHLVGEVEPGRILFNRYLVEKKLGEGGMGTVWLVRHIELDVLRALKLIVSGIAFDPLAQARFKREARVMARLAHPNVIVVYDARMAKDAAFIEMEYVKGQSLNKLLKPGVPMPLDWTARILEQLCDVLHEAHTHKVVHRNLKPAKLMLVDGRPPGKEQLKVLVSGIAKILGEDLDTSDFLTNPGDFMGSAPWSSPEQACAAPVDARSDLYAVGVILYELLTGHRPFSGPIVRVLYNHVNTPPPSFAERNPSVVVPPMVERVVMRCLAKKPEDRPQTARDLYEEFQAALRGNRESRAPGIRARVEQFLADVFRRLGHRPI